jgi:hypothetical protein
MVFGIFPMLPLLFYEAMKDTKEDQVFQLTKSMGLKPKSIFATYIVMQNILTLSASIIVFILMKIIFFPNGNIFIIFLYMMLNAQVVVVQLTFFAFASGTLGKVLYVSLQLFTTILGSAF